MLPSAPQELLSTLGMAGSNDIALMKLRLFCLLENAAWFLAFRSGKDQCMSDVTPHYLGGFSWRREYRQALNPHRRL